MRLEIMGEIGTGDEARVAEVVERTLELAGSDLEGIDQAARELAGLCQHDAATLNGARKQLRLLAEDGPSPLFRQAASLLRRAFELGEWHRGFYDTPEVP